MERAKSLKAERARGDAEGTFKPQVPSHLYIYIYIYL
jgi:hypothetical protein